MPRSCPPAKRQTDRVHKQSTHWDQARYAQIEKEYLRSYCHLRNLTSTPTDATWKSKPTTSRWNPSWRSLSRVRQNAFKVWWWNFRNMIMRCSMSVARTCTWPIHSPERTYRRPYIQLEVKLRTSTPVRSFLYPHLDCKKSSRQLRCHIAWMARRL